MTVISRILLILVLSLGSIWGAPNTLRAAPYNIMQMAGGLNQPWAFGFLPGGSVLITERGGRLLLVLDATRHEITGVPKVHAQGQGGLLDVLVPRDFAQSRQLYFTYSKPQSGGAGTAVAVATFAADSTRLTNWKVIFELTPGSTGGRHFGSRIVEGRDGFLYVTIGDRGEPDAAQDLTRENGSIVRIARDGQVPGENPFTRTPGAQPEIWSYGHRNPQGATLDAQGRLWVVEHGPKGGDEVNLIRKGANFGWPLIGYGRHYSGDRIGVGTAKAGLEQPVYYWDPSIAPSGIMIYSGRLWPQWRGDIFVGSLKFGYIARLSGEPMREMEKIKTAETARVRDIREGPDGAIWFLSARLGALFRLSP